MTAASTTAETGSLMRVKRLPNNPIITPSLDKSIGRNINGPSLIRVPEWVENPLGKYYLYFAHHQGTYIRLAYANELAGPWHIYRPGVLHLHDAYASTHIASPDVHVLHDKKEIRMYYHGCCQSVQPHQYTHLAFSKDGLHFTANPEILGSSYWRVFRWQSNWYTLEMPGTFRRSRNGISEFVAGPTLFTPNMRHAAVLRKGHRLSVFYSNAFDCPECILWSQIDLRHDWHSWHASKPQIVLVPETQYEGVDCVVKASKRGAIHKRVHQLRDPCIFEDDDAVYLLYSVAGENGIAIAEFSYE